MFRLPGWDKHSYGYHGDDGHSFCSSGTGTSIGSGSCLTLPFCFGLFIALFITTSYYCIPGFYESSLVCLNKTSIHTDHRRLPGYISMIFGTGTISCLEFWKRYRYSTGTSCTVAGREIAGTCDAEPWLDVDICKSIINLPYLDIVR